MTTATREMTMTMTTQEMATQAAIAAIHTLATCHASTRDQICALHGQLVLTCGEHVFTYTGRATTQSV